MNIKDIKNLPLKIASFIILSTYVVSLVLLPVDTLVFTIILILCVSAGIVLAAILNKLSKE